MFQRQSKRAATGVAGHRTSSISPDRALHPLEPRLHFASHPLTDLPLLHSRTGAAAQIYLDLDGQPAEMWGFNSVPATPAYDTDGDATTFSDTELAAIRQIWAAVSEKYAPFNIDVTTADPDPVTHNYPHNKVYRVVIGGNGSWTGSVSGGITLQEGAFYLWYVPNTSYVFSKNLSRVNSVADASAHEAGHGFGLIHQSSYSGTTKIADYNPGDAYTAPIMGISYNAARALWWKGPNSYSSTSIQDDLAILSNASNGFGYAADDHADNITAADALTASGDNLTGDGVIGNTSDKDYFKFTTIGGAVSFTATPGRYVLAQTGSSAGSMLDLTLELRDSSGNIITAADTTSMGETLSTTLAAGTYYLSVGSHGNYGDIGSYAISGSAPQPAVGTGLSATYFDNADLSGTQVSRTDSAIDFNWGSDAPLTGISPGTYSVRWRGKIQAPQSGAYSLILTADDGVRLWVNGNLLINRWRDVAVQGDINGDGAVDLTDFDVLFLNFGKAGSRSDGDLNGDGKVDFKDYTILQAAFGNHVNPVTDQASVTLAAGQQYDLQVEYYQATGPASVRLEWTTPSGVRQVVPTSALFPPAIPSSPAVTAAVSAVTTPVTRTVKPVFSPVPVLPPQKKQPPRRRIISQFT